VASHETNN